ncbi:MAG: hypothetical protein AUJ51_06680 [Elusimicrobia bacterium CG1_02_56_21]|nr:MAG: hypothetical protein AUJ51_06680 [Elusimicrobia bacterium CG1_02_56_21]
MEFSYRNLKVWQKSLALIKSVYAAAELLPKHEDYILKQRIKTAVVSVALNIAEGKSRKTAKEFSQFLNISAGSLHEVDAVLVICLELGYLKSIDEIHGKIEELAKMLNAFRGSLNTNEI